MFSWVSCAVVRASAMNRSARLGEVSVTNLSATSRPRRTSRARYTCPMPPRPSKRMISCCSILVPAWTTGA